MIPILNYFLGYISIAGISYPLLGWVSLRFGTRSQLRSLKWKGLFAYWKVWLSRATVYWCVWYKSLQGLVDPTKLALSICWSMPRIWIHVHLLPLLIQLFSPWFHSPVFLAFLAPLKMDAFSMATCASVYQGLWNHGKSSWIWREVDEDELRKEACFSKSTMRILWGLPILVSFWTKFR